MKQAVRRKYHYIYKITRIDTGRFYIGMHSTDNLDDGYFGSGKIITASIKKHGKEKHIKEILEYLPTREALKLREKEIIGGELLGNKACMNLKLGGDGGFDHLNIPENRNQKITAGNKAREIFKQKFQDKAFSESWGRRTSVNNKKTYVEGRKPVGWSSKALEASKTKESNDKRSATMKLKQSGSQNSQFGTCWVTNGKETIKIKKGNIIDYLKNGYQQGRIRHA